MFITSAGACQAGYDGQLTQPVEAGAPRLREGSVTKGIDATFGQLSRRESDGEECYYFVRVQRYGLGSTASGCADTGGIEEALKSRMWPGDTQTGDDGFVDDELTVRTVHRDGLAEVLVLTEIAIRPCTEVTTGITTGESPDVPLNEYQLQQPWVLIQGALGDVAAGDDSCC